MTGMNMLWNQFISSTRLWNMIYTYFYPFITCTLQLIAEMPNPSIYKAVKQLSVL